MWVKIGPEKGRVNQAQHMAVVRMAFFWRGVMVADL
jgi:hypothetical protein